MFDTKSMLVLIKLFSYEQTYGEISAAKHNFYQSIIIFLCLSESVCQQLSTEAEPSKNISLQS